MGAPGHPRIPFLSPRGRRKSAYPAASAVMSTAVRRFLPASAGAVRALSTLSVPCIAAPGRMLPQRSVSSASITPTAHAQTICAAVSPAPAPPRRFSACTSPNASAESHTYTDGEYQRTAAELTRKGIRFKEPQRYKGLGEMDAHQLAETTMDPGHRTLRRLTVDDAAAAERTFEMLMGNEVAPRKEFIVRGAYSLEADRIDV